MSLDEVVHPKFSYVFIPVDINDPVEERTFEGKEHNFRELLNSHFNRENLLKAEEDSFKKDLSQKADGKLTDAQLSCLVSGQHTYQIIPLSLPCKASNFAGTNAYIDSIGRVKRLPTNARASRVCSTDIRGDCFLSRVFDDEETFRRVDLKTADYEHLMQDPPDPKGRWSETEALAQLIKAQGQQEKFSSSSSSLSTTTHTTKTDAADRGKRCGYCRKREEELSSLSVADSRPPSSSSPGGDGAKKEDAVSSSSSAPPSASAPSPTTTPAGDNQAEKKKKRLKRCGRCGEVFYCSEECQRADWSSHKRVCKKKN